MLQRVTDHFLKGGKFFQKELDDAVYHYMPGSDKIEREVYEQYLINRLGGVASKEGSTLLNIRNPMGGRKDLYDELIEGVLSNPKWNLPRY